MGVLLLWMLAAAPPAGALAANPACEVREAPGEALSPGAVPLQGEVQSAGLEAIEATVGGPGEQPPPVDHADFAENLLGAQYGGMWFANAAPAFYLGLTAGPLSVAEATALLDGVLRKNLAPEAAANVEAHLRVQPVPYSPSELKAIQAAITPELFAEFPGELSTGQGVGEAGGGSLNYFPQVSVILNRNATEADCEAILRLIAPYGSAVSLLRTDDGPPVAEIGVGPAVTPGGKPLAAKPKGRAPHGVGLHAGLAGGRLRLALTLAPRGARAVRVEVLLVRRAGRPARIVRVLRTDGAGRLVAWIGMPGSFTRASELRVEASAEIAGRRLTGAVVLHPARR